MRRRGFLKILGVSATGLALATLDPEIAAPVRRFWSGWRPEFQFPVQDSTQIIAGRDVMVYHAPMSGRVVATDWSMAEPWTQVDYNGLHLKLGILTHTVLVDQLVDPAMRITSPIFRGAFD